MPYYANDDYCEKAEEYQSVPSEDQARSSLDEWGENTSANVERYRIDTKYSCNDSYQMGTINDDHIFVSTTDNQHRQILNGETPSADGGISGYFTDRATVDNCKNGEVLDNGQINRELQIAPHQMSAHYTLESKLPANRQLNKNLQLDSYHATSPHIQVYKPHLDCFKINHDKLEETYGTRDFNAALAKCNENNQFGEGGGNQGFNPYLSEMMSNGCLEHDKANSFSDSSLSKLDPNMQNDRMISNSTVKQTDYRIMMNDARDRSLDCVKNNTKHPSQSVIDATGYSHNPNPVQGMTGNATPIHSNQQIAKGSQTGENNQQNIKDPQTGEKNHQNTNSLQSPINADKASPNQPQVKSGENHSAAQVYSTKNNAANSQADNSEKSGSNGMPTTAANTTKSTVGSDKEASAGMAASNVSGSKQTKENSQQTINSNPPKIDEDKTSSNQLQAKSSEGYTAAQIPSAKGKGANSQINNNEKSGSEGMPTTAANTHNSGSGSDKGASAGMATSNVSSSNVGNGNSSSGSGMSTTAAGHSGNAPSSSSGQSRGSGRGM